MAKLFSDGFDPYSVIADATTHWGSTATNDFSLSTTTPFNTGKSLTTGGNSASATHAAFTTNTLSNESVWFLNFRFLATNINGTADIAGFQLLDGASVQLSLIMRSDGSIVVRSGDRAAAVATQFSSAYVATVWTHFQIKLTIHNTAGRMQVRTNGASSDTFDSGATLNTRGGTTNFYANKVQLVTFGSFASSHAQQFDDFYAFSGSGAAPNDWVGDIKCKCAYPSADTAQKDFSPYISTLIGLSTGLTGSTTRTVNANTIATVSTSTTATQSGVVTKGTVYLSAGFTGNAKIAIYDNTGAGSAPGALLCVSDVVVNPVAGGQDFLFTVSPATLVSGTDYYLAWLADTNATFIAAGSVTSYTKAQSYGSGFPTPLSGLSGTTSQFTAFSATVSISNASCVDDTQEDGDSTYVSSPTVAARDLYNITYTDIPGTIIDVTQRAFMKKSSSGTRNGQLVQKAGGGSHTVTLGTDTIESSSYTWHRIDGPLNPDTGLAWTPSEVAALQIGQQVSA